MPLENIYNADSFLGAIHATRNAVLLAEENSPEGNFDGVKQVHDAVCSEMRRVVKERKADLTVEEADAVLGLSKLLQRILAREKRFIAGLHEFDSMVAGGTRAVVN